MTSLVLQYRRDDHLWREDDALMTTDSAVLQEAEALLTRMSPAEKATLLQWVARDLGAFPGIASAPAVLDGEAVIVRTRIPVWALARMRQLGATYAELLQAYPTLRAEDLVNALVYERAHRVEIERQIAESEALLVAETVR